MTQILIRQQAIVIKKVRKELLGVQYTCSMKTYCLFNVHNMFVRFYRYKFWILNTTAKSKPTKFSPINRIMESTSFCLVSPIIHSPCRLFGRIDLIITWIKHGAKPYIHICRHMHYICIRVGQWTWKNLLLLLRQQRRHCIIVCVSEYVLDWTAMPVHVVVVRLRVI